LILIDSDWFKEMGGWPSGLSITADFDIDFDAGGHYDLIPPLPEDVAPADHIFAGFKFLGKEIPFTGILKNAVTGEWRTKKNHDHNLAFVAHPLSPKYATTFKEFLKLACMQPLLPITFEMEAPPVAKVSTVTIEELPPDDSPSVATTRDGATSIGRSSASSGQSALEVAPLPAAQRAATLGGNVITVPSLRPEKSDRKRAAMAKLAKLQDKIPSQETEKDEAATTAAALPQGPASPDGAIAPIAEEPDDVDDLLGGLVGSPQL
jgi:hypothetical protein